jgi:hypothetical protein
MISLSELNSHNVPTTPEIDSNLQMLLDKINVVRSNWGKPMTVTSGLRSQADQQRINPKATHSNHLMGLAVDIYDPDGELKQWVLDNLDSLTDFWFEDFRYTSDWVHFQIVPYGSWVTGKTRFFIP